MYWPRSNARGWCWKLNVADDTSNVADDTSTEMDDTSTEMRQEIIVAIVPVANETCLVWKLNVADDTSTEMRQEIIVAIVPVANETCLVCSARKAHRNTAPVSSTGNDIAPQ